MRKFRWLTCAAALLAWSELANSVPIYGVSAYVATDAGNAHTFENVPFDTIGNVATTGVITQALADNAFGGGQSAMTSAYASIGSLGGKILAESTFGSSPSSAQAFNDLSWYFDWKPTGAPGSKVVAQFSQLFEGSVAGAGLDDRGFSGGTHATAFVGGSLLSDADFNVLVNPGPFSVLVSKTFEFTVGEIVRLNSRLTVGAHAELTSNISVDAFNTSKFFIDVLTPGAGYNTEDFRFATLLPSPDPGGDPDPGPGPTPTPVSEPPALLLLVFAIAATGLATRGRLGRGRQLACRP
jgi:hypothetical protein